MTAMRTLAVLVTCLAAGLAWAAGTYKVGDVVTDDTLALADGKDAKLSSYEGSTVMLFFYGNWTRQAAADAKAIDAMRVARATQKFVVVGIARDVKRDAAKKFGDDAKLGFVQAADATKGLPWIAVLDGKRKLKYSAAGIDDEAIDAALTELLGAKDPPPEKKKDSAPADGGGKK